MSLTSYQTAPPRSYRYNEKECTRCVIALQALKSLFWIFFESRPIWPGLAEKNRLIAGRCRAWRGG